MKLPNLHRINIPEFSKKNNVLFVQALEALDDNGKLDIEKLQAYSCISFLSTEKNIALPSSKTNECLIKIATTRNQERLIISNTTQDDSEFPNNSPVCLLVSKENKLSDTISSFVLRLDQDTIPQDLSTAQFIQFFTYLLYEWKAHLEKITGILKPDLLRAAIYANSISDDSNLGRTFNPEFNLDKKNIAFTSSPIKSSLSKQWSIVPSGNQPIKIAVVPTYSCTASTWSVPRATIKLKSGDKIDQRAAWAFLKLEKIDGPQSISLTVTGRVRSVSIFAINAKEIIEEKPKATVKPDQIIVGIAVSHDASACIIRNGKLETAIQLERLSRIKRDGASHLHTSACIEYCLSALNIAPEHVDLFAFNTQNILPQQVGLSRPVADQSFDIFDPFSEKVVFVSHHLAHAFAAYFSSPFESDTIVMVADGSGGSTIGADDLLMNGIALKEYLKKPVPTPRPPYHVQSSYIFNSHQYKLIDREYARSFHPMCGHSSIGETYASVSQYIFGSWQEGGKLMGLAPYGNASLVESYLKRDENDRMQFSDEWKWDHRKANHREQPMAYSALAARVQKDLELAMLDRTKNIIAKTNLQQMAYSGGIALNSVANNRLLEETALKKLYLLPASNDAGISIGAAAAAHFYLNKKTKGQPVISDYRGFSYPDSAIQRTLEQWKTFLQIEKFDFDNVNHMLTHKNVLGWFEGGSEFGPRALGHRSIIASPFEKSMWLHLNKSIKYREEFRPYAPVVLAEKANEYFEMGKSNSSPYMLRVVPVKKQFRKRLEAITHKDGTARVQTVNAQTHPRWHKVLDQFGKTTGIPILINTSMNVRGEPIVETPEQAIELLLSTQIDALVIGNYIVKPYVHSDQESIENLSLRLGPKVELSNRINLNNSSFEIICKARGNISVIISSSVFKILSHLDFKQNLGNLLKEFTIDATEKKNCLQQIGELVQKRILLIQKA